MEDFSGQQFYDVRGPEEPIAGVPAPFKQWRKWLIFGVIIFAVVLGIYVLVRFRVDQNQEAQQMDIAQVNILREAEKCSASERELCLNRLWTEAAISAGISSYCAQVTGEWSEACLMQVAAVTLDLVDCRVSDQSLQTTCQDAVLYDLAVLETSLEDCEQIENELLRNNCAQLISTTLAKTGSCPSTGFGSDICAGLIKFRLAVAAADCSGYESGSVGLESCIDVLAGRDSDGDQLSDWEEVNRYDTDPKNADTDGDGYDDNTEIISGYDPLQ